MLLTASAAACGGEAGVAPGPEPARLDDQPRSSGAPDQPIPSNTGGQVTPPPAAGASAAPAASASAPAPKTAADCKALGAKITPPSSNHTDTQLQMRAFFDAYRETFRCCFDALWASQHAGASGTVNLLVSIDGTGAFSAAEIDPANTTVQSAEVQTCIVDIAKALTYPRPSSGKNIKYSRLLNFSPHR